MIFYQVNDYFVLLPKAAVPLIGEGGSYPLKVSPDLQHMELEPTATALGFQLLTGDC